MLEFELWTALYLVCGVATYLCVKKTIVENTSSPEAHTIAALMVIAIWWLVVLFYLAGSLRYYIYERPKNYIGWALDRAWLRRHKKHGTVISWGVDAAGSEGPCYWTCECSPHKRYYPHNMPEPKEA